MRVLFVVAALGAGPAWGQDYFKNGQDILDECSAEKTELCFGYIMGAADMLRLLSNGLPLFEVLMFGRWRTLPNICPPDGVTATDYRAAVVDYIGSDPKHLIANAPIVAYSAMVGAFPCE